PSATIAVLLSYGYHSFTRISLTTPGASTALPSSLGTNAGSPCVRRASQPVTANPAPRPETAAKTIQGSAAPLLCASRAPRSEEHTSELQSREKIECRL